MNILRFITAGSVDDGKSTLIGRLLYDSSAVLADQLEAIQRSSRKNEDGSLDLAILTDGLKAEREQGITIDVAYKYFQTSRRKFIIADTPGHIQYTRNMVTGASNADAAIILVDARNGVVEQTIRHSYLVSLLGIRHVVICINKMDMVNYDQAVFERIKISYKALATKLGLNEVVYIPASALKGDNVVDRSLQMPWYKGESLLEYLENVPPEITQSSAKARIPVQWVIRPQTDDLHDYRGYAGRIISGSFAVNDKVTIQPSGTESVISRIETFDEDLEIADSGRSVTIHLQDNVDVSRGDVILKTEQLSHLSQLIEADLCWMDTRVLDTTVPYFVQHNSKLTRCRIVDILHKVNINTLEQVEGADFQLNDIGRVVLKTADPLAFDLFQENKANGCAILIDSRTHVTVGALLFRAVVE